MRTLITWILTLAVVAWAAKTTAAQAQSNPAAPRRTTPTPKSARPTAPVIDPAAAKAKLDADRKAIEDMEPVLAEWEKRSKTISSLDVLFDRIDRSEAFGDQYYQGRAMLQSPDRACLQFQKYKLDPNGKPLFQAGKDGRPAPQLEPEPYERIVCTGAEVLQYSWDDRKIFVFPLDKQSRQKALQQGPLPFLFNMKAADAKKRYTMRLLKEDDKEYLIGVTPKEDIDKDSFSMAFLWLSKTTFLPNKLELHMAGDKEKQEFKFTGNYNTIWPNTKLDQNFFQPNKYTGWKVIDNPGENATAPAKPGPGGVAAGKRQVPQQGMRPTGRPQ